MRATRRQKTICGALGGIAALVLVSALVLKRESLRFWQEEEIAPRFQGGMWSGTGPPIDAVVQAVRASEGLVVLSVGRDQKVEEGFQFTVYRGQKLVGKVRVIKVYEDLAGARILSTENGESIQPGDQAATQL